MALPPLASPLPPAQRAAIIDLGSNSVRMVVFEGVARNPVPIFNEKATLQLGKGLEKTGCLSEPGMHKAMEVLGRFGRIATAMGADPFVVVATAAVRDARNGPQFIEAASRHLPQASFRILRGEEEADYAAAGVLCALPEADGLAADIGGGSMELIRISGGTYTNAVTTPLGVIRLAERADDNVLRARDLAEKVLADISWLPSARGRPLYLVGGGFRALARAEISRLRYPLNMVHLFRLTRAQAWEMARWCLDADAKTLEKLGNVPRKRVEQVPYAAAVLEALLMLQEPDEVVFSAEGLREGWYMRHVAAEVQHLDPMQALAREMAARLGRNTNLPAELVAWTAPLFAAHESPEQSELRGLACLVSDIGSYDHPQYRAEQTYRRLLYCHGVGFEHRARAFLALVLAVRYEMGLNDPVLKPSRKLLSPEMFERAVQLGLALRLAYTLCGGNEALLRDSHLAIEDGTLVLKIRANGLRMAGSALRRRFEKLAEALHMPGRICED
ncbi:Ppx/GppA family phosphatase [Oecophyllibacter saccharovorans]|uniref:Ppx/GppA family phosphatase n=1 Tax=Oecophyllibacter saccharovorans TaxID=2558360 RepID=UPI0011428EEF|nr:Ppx/GppA family phosphatase [Oecophyllibacter saccharovorans]QDH15730.1 Ppx/GppA family phosphatase [Oecophyllibacter saccharovorans]